MDGVLVVHKPVGPSSHDIVAVARRSLGISRIGHTGTLDPMASGVLPLVLGQATRLAQYLTGSDKEYEAVLRFGVVTATRDTAGEMIESSGKVPRVDQVVAALPQFRGTYQQVPPVFSAKMVGGERSYVRARAGKPMVSAAVSVTVHTLDLLSFNPPQARLRIRCSAGFYVRSLAHDLGQVLGTGAILDDLVRTEAAGFAINDAMAFEALVKAPRTELRDAIRPMESLLTELPSVVVTSEGLEWAKHGRNLGPRQFAQVPDAARLGVPLVRLLGTDGRLVGLADPANVPGFLHPAVVFSYN